MDYTVHGVKKSRTGLSDFHFHFHFLSLTENAFKGSFLGFPGSSQVKASACNAGDPGLIPGSGRSPGGGDGNPLQYSCLENPMDRGAWQAAVHVVTESRTRLSDLTFTFMALQDLISSFFSYEYHSIF